MYCLRCYPDAGPSAEPRCPVCSLPLRDKSGRERYSVQLRALAEQLQHGEAPAAEAFEHALKSLSAILDNMHRDMLWFEEEARKSGLLDIPNSPALRPLETLGEAVDVMTEGVQLLHGLQRDTEAPDVRKWLALVEKGENLLAHTMQYAGSIVRHAETKPESN